MNNKHMLSIEAIREAAEGTYQVTQQGRIAHTIRIVREWPNRSIYWNNNVYSGEEYIRQAFGVSHLNPIHPMAIMTQVDENAVSGSTLVMYAYGTDYYRIRWENDTNVLHIIPRERGEHADTFRSRAIMALENIATERRRGNNIIRTKLL